MASIYNTKITIVSDFVNYPEEELLDILENILNNYRDKKTGLGLRVQNIELKREA